jgi:hypothetical protein
MHIDAREIELNDLLTRLKDVLTSQRGCELDIEILVNSAHDAKKIKSFVSMSGGITQIDKMNNYYIIHVTGNICCA